MMCRAVSVALVPLTIAPFAAGSLNPVMDAVFCGTILIHSHIGFQYVQISLIANSSLTLQGPLSLTICQKNEFPRQGLFSGGVSMPAHFLWQLVSTSSRPTMLVSRRPLSASGTHKVRLCLCFFACTPLIRLPQVNHSVDFCQDIFASEIVRRYKISLHITAFCSGLRPLDM